MVRVIAISTNNFTSPINFATAEEFVATKQEAITNFLQRSNVNRSLRYSHLLMFEFKTGARERVSQSYFE